MAMTSIEHIELDQNRTARIAGTRSRVINIVLDMRNGLTPIQIHEQYPHLSLAQIHAALAYYYDHQAEIDAAIENEMREAATSEKRPSIQPSRAELAKRAAHGKSGNEL